MRGKREHSCMCVCVCLIETNAERLSIANSILERCTTFNKTLLGCMQTALTEYYIFHRAVLRLRHCDLAANVRTYPFQVSDLQIAVV